LGEEKKEKKKVNEKKRERKWLYKIIEIKENPTHFNEVDGVRLFERYFSN
jgi:hypothetical protein